MRSSTRLLLTAPALAVLLLAGCTPIVALKPAPDAVNPDCAKVIVAVPETVADLPSRETDAQGTAAWGNPTGVILRCGVPAPAPTAALPCITVQGVDWLRDGSKDPNFVFTTYGRDPAVEVILNGTEVSGLATLTDLSAAVATTPASRQCISPEDTTK